MKTDRELDIEIADKVLGIIKRTEQHPERGYVSNGTSYSLAFMPCDSDPRKVNDTWTHVKDNLYATEALPHYSTDIHDAYKVIAYFAAREISITMEHGMHGLDARWDWCIKFTKYCSGAARNRSLTSAICEAALAYVHDSERLY
jgi:Phage ABA sandwich domain